MSKAIVRLSCIAGLGLLGLSGCAPKNLYDCYSGALDAAERRECIASGEANVTLEPGQSITQAIFDMPADAEHWVVKLRPGVYRETVAVDRSGVMLVGTTSEDRPDERAIIDGSLDGGKLRKDAVIVSGSRFVMDGITVKNYSGNGVTTSKSLGVTLRNLVTDKTGHYGVYPVESEDILVEDCTATGINDAGIYVGQSRRATVRGNHVYGNVAGIEIENTVTALVEKEVEYNPAGTDGSQIATGILYRAIDATAADTKGTAYKRNCEHNADIVVWKTGITTTQIAKGTADLKRRGILLR